MPSITLSNKTERQLRREAAHRGMDKDAYADELLAISLAALHDAAKASPHKPNRAMQFSAIAPTGRSASEIDSEIEEGRAEWDEEPGDSTAESTTPR